MANSPLILLIDGHALIFVAYNALKMPMTLSSTGEPIGAVYGFMNSFLRIISDFQPTHCAIAFDRREPTFRHDLFDQYKANRPPTPEDLPAQVELVKGLMKAFKVPIFDAKGFEADDVLGTLCSQSDDSNLDSVIVTVDTDTLQLVSNKTKVYISTAFNRKIYDIEEVNKRYDGLSPELVPDIKGLQGDTSDNIPGVPGIGIKTALKLLKQYKTIDGVYENISDVAPERIKNLLIKNKESAIQSKDLATIRRSVPIQLDLNQARFPQYDNDELIKHLRSLEFNSMIQRLPRQESETPIEVKDKVVPVEYEIVEDLPALESLIATLNSTDSFSFDTETTSIDPMKAQLVGMSFSNGIGRAWYIPVGHIEKLALNMDGQPTSPNQLPLDVVLEKIRPVFQNDTPKIAHNASYDATVLLKYDIHIKNLFFDTMLAAHLAGKRSVGLKNLVFDIFGHQMTSIEELIGTGKKQITIDEAPISQVAQYAAADADFTYRLHQKLFQTLKKESLLKSFDEIEMPLVDVIVKMQANGVSIDLNLLKEMSTDLTNRITGIKKDLFSLIGHEFNVSSSKQLAEVLFSELKLKPVKKTATGFSTDAASLDAIKTNLDSGQDQNADPRSYETIAKILEYRELTKLKSTYVDVLPQLVNRDTGRVHTSYRQTGSSTGRVSSNDPNVQNIPVRTELGRKVRNAFIPQDQHSSTLIAADYSQIELRVLAHLSKDVNLIEAFNNDEDIHASTSSLVYGVPISKVTTEMRRVAKVLNFGVLYGLTPFGISQQTDLSPDKGKEFISIFFNNYPGIKEYIDKTIIFCQQNNYVESMKGRRRYLPEINSNNRIARQAAERAAINMPIQGTAADAIKISMIKIQKQLNLKNIASKMILQVHDELVFESKLEELNSLKVIIEQNMTNAIKLDVPLKIEMKTGNNWGNMSKLITPIS
tara:strand:+ start:15841 stop:18639 length:2799 start_codon:yes stop_codon:yes gene_type:complete